MFLTLERKWDVTYGLSPRGRGYATARRQSGRWQSSPAWVVDSGLQDLTLAIQTMEDGRDGPGDPEKERVGGRNGVFEELGRKEISNFGNCAGGQIFFIFGKFKPIFRLGKKGS